MLNVEKAYRGFGPIEDERGVVPLLAIREVSRAALEREQAAIEAQDVLSQADEALVMG